MKAWLLGKDPATKSDEFLEKCQRGGVIFNPKIYVADFGNFKQGFLSMEEKETCSKKKSCLSHISGRGLIRPAACHVWSEPSDFFISSWSS